MTNSANQSIVHGISVTDAALRFPLFDGLRACAVIGVAYSHWMPERFQFGVPWGRLGVQLFFVLSGFLITNILLRECAKITDRNNRDRLRLIRAFIARRALRIFPIYWLTLITAALLGLQEVREDFWWHFLYASNVLFAIEQEWSGAASHLWTLAVEEQFYVVWPFLIVFVTAAWRKWVVVLTIVACLLAAVALAALPQDVRTFFGLLPVPAFLGIATGALMAMLRREGVFLTQLGRPAAILASAVLLSAVLAVASTGSTYSPLGDAVTPIALVAFAACVIAWATEPRDGLFPRLLQLKPVVYLGTISYGFYLYHNFVPSGLAYAVREGWVSSFVNWGIQAPLIRFGLTLVVAAVSWHLIERPLSRLRTSITYVSAGSGGNDSTAASSTERG